MSRITSQHSLGRAFPFYPVRNKHEDCYFGGDYFKDEFGKPKQDVNKTLVAVLNALHTTFEARLGDLLNIERLERKIDQLSERSSVLARIQTLSPEPYQLLKEISVVLVQDGDDFRASFLDANINTSGSSQLEAFENLKELIISRFDSFNEAPPEKLGPGPRKQIAVLREFIRRTA